MEKLVTPMICRAGSNYTKSIKIFYDYTSNISKSVTMTPCQLQKKQKQLIPKVYSAFFIIYNVLLNLDVF